MMGARERTQSGLRLLRLLRPIAIGEGSLLIPIAAFLACTTRFARGSSCGHDFDFHLISWMEIRRSWAQGVLYPHWAQSPNFGAGEPRFIFYPPIESFLGALLSKFLYWDWIGMGIIFLSLTAAGLATRALARRFLPAANATLAGLIATAAPYALFTAYERSALAELAAASLIPLLLLFALKPPSAARPSYSLFPVPCSLTLAAIWLTNAPAGVMASYLLAFVALTAAILHRRWWPILRAAVAFPLAVGLAAFYIVPAAYEQRWVAIHLAVDVGMRIQDSWLFARHTAPDLELHDTVLRLASTILVFTAAAAAAAFGIAYLRGKLPRETRAYWLPLALLIPVILLLQFPISTLIWDLPKLQFLQFPWRWLMVLGTPFAIFLAAATPFSSRWAKVLSPLLWMVLIGASTAVSTLFFFQSCDSEDDPLNQFEVFKAGTGVEGTDEYAPVGSDNSEIASDLPDACLVSDPRQDLGESAPDSAPVWYEEQGSCDDTFVADVWQAEYKHLDVEADQSGYLILRLARYPAWQITVDSKPVKQPVEREDGLIVIPVPAGQTVVEARWTTTPDILWGRTISGVSIIVSTALLIPLWIFRRRSRRTVEKTAPATMGPNS